MTVTTGSYSELLPVAVPRIARQYNIVRAILYPIPAPYKEIYPPKKGNFPYMGGLGVSK